MTTKALELPFGEWLPDLPAHKNPGALIAKNVIPQLTSFRSLNSLSSFTDALDDVCLGAFWAQDSNNVIQNFSGDAAKLYKLNSSTSAWDDISKPATTYAASHWEFEKFGERIIGVNGTDNTQYYDMLTSTTFDDLPNAPAANRIAVVRDFVMLGDVVNLGPNFLHWSGFNNSEKWDPSLATQSDTQELFGRGGRIQKITSGEYANIILEHSIFRADYVGAPIVFQIDEVERRRGTPSPDSVISLGPYVWYFGYDGFYQFDGSESTNISENKISKWFLKTIDGSSLPDIRGVVDRKNALLFWAFKSSSSSVVNDRVLIYSLLSQRWSYAEVDTQMLGEYLSSGFTLDQLDTLLADIDSESINLETTTYQGGDLNLVAFDNSNRTATFSGDAMEGCLETKEVTSPDGRKLFTNAVRPLIEGDADHGCTVQISHRDSLKGSPTLTSPPRGLNAYNGEANIRVNKRYQRIRVNTTGEYEHANGVKMQVRSSTGRR